MTGSTHMMGTLKHLKMMAGLNISFLLVLFVVFYLIFLLLWTGILLIFRRTRRFGYMLLSLPVYVFLIWLYFYTGSRPTAVFTRSFGFAPPADVSSIQSERFFLGDSGAVYLHFTCAQTTIQRIAGRGLASSSSASSPFNWIDDRNAPPSSSQSV